MGRWKKIQILGKTPHITKLNSTGETNVVRHSQSLLIPTRETINRYVLKADAVTIGTSNLLHCMPRPLLAVQVCSMGSDGASLCHPVAHLLYYPNDQTTSAIFEKPRVAVAGASQHAQIN